jgi:hypothetical protein
LTEQSLFEGVEDAEADEAGLYTFFITNHDKNADRLNEENNPDRSALAENLGSML